MNMHMFHVGIFYFLIARVCLIYFLFCYFKIIAFFSVLLHTKFYFHKNSTVCDNWEHIQHNIEIDFCTNKSTMCDSCY